MIRFPLIEIPSDHWNGKLHQLLVLNFGESTSIKQCQRADVTGDGLQGKSEKMTFGSELTILLLEQNPYNNISLSLWTVNTALKPLL
jgi:hypothetical protein